MPPGILAGILVVIFITLGEMFAMPFMNSFWITRTNNNNRGEYAGLYTMAWSTAQVLAPTAGAQLINFGGFSLLWWILGGVCLVSAIGFNILYRYIVPNS